MVPQHAAVELKDLLAAGLLVQAVDVLGDDGLQLPLPLPFRQLAVGGVGLGVQGQHFGPVEVVEFLGVRLVKCVAEHGLRRVFEFLAVQAVHTAEVRDAGFGGHAAPPKNTMLSLASVSSFSLRMVSSILSLHFFCKEHTL